MRMAPGSALIFSLLVHSIKAEASVDLRHDFEDGSDELFRSDPLREVANYYPPLPSSAAQGVTPSNYEEVNALALKAATWVGRASNELNFTSTAKAMKEWFGKSDETTMAVIKKVLESLHSILHKVRFDYPGHHCIEPGLGYVFAHGKKCFQQLTAKKCRVDGAGKPIIYLCPPWNAMGTSDVDEKKKIQIIMTWALFHAPALREQKCVDRSECAALATSNSTDAIASNSNFVFFVTAIADPPYAESFRCKASTGSITPFVNGAGDCKCGAGHTCQKEDAPCPYSGGHSSTFFSNTCDTCECVSSSAQPLGIPSAPAHDAPRESMSRGTLPFYILVPTIALVLFVGVALYCYRKRVTQKSRRVVSDMEFQEDLQTQHA